MSNGIVLNLDRGSGGGYKFIHVLKFMKCTPKKRVIFGKFFTKTVVKRQMKTHEGRMILSSNKSLSSTLISSLLKF